MAQSKAAVKRFSSTFPLSRAEAVSGTLFCKRPMDNLLLGDNVKNESSMPVNDPVDTGILEKLLTQEPKSLIKKPFSVRTNLQ